jgi:hypothetical protein
MSFLLVKKIVSMAEKACCQDAFVSGKYIISDEEVDVGSHSGERFQEVDEVAQEFLDFYNWSEMDLRQSDALTIICQQISLLKGLISGMWTI